MRSERGEAKVLGAAIGGLLLIVAYMLYPEPFHNGVQFLINTVLDSVRDAFGNPDAGDNLKGPGSNGEGQLDPSSAGPDATLGGGKGK